MSNNKDLNNEHLLNIILLEILKLANSFCIRLSQLDSSVLNY